jgi:hypothetical protein
MDARAAACSGVCCGAEVGPDCSAAACVAARTLLLLQLLLSVCRVPAVACNSSRPQRAGGACPAP